jgi:hypothetical protein
MFEGGGKRSVRFRDGARGDACSGEPSYKHRISMCIQFVTEAC